MGKCIGLAGGVGVFLAASQVLAAPAFTAEAVHIQSGQPPKVGQIFIDDQGSRFEFEHNGKLSVQIILPALGIIRLLFPQSKTYVETVQSPLHSAAAASMNQLATPCPPSSIARCERTGTEVLNGQTVEVWRVSFNPVSKESVSRESIVSFQIWWDAERKLAMREQYPDGSSSTAILLGHVAHQGRSVERWQVTLTGSEGKIVQTSSLYDPELQINIREEYPDGSVRELRNIHLASLDLSWFEIPAGYRRLDPQTTMGGGKLSYFSNRCTKSRSQLLGITFLCPHHLEDRESDLSVFLMA